MQRANRRCRDVHLSREVRPKYINSSSGQHVRLPPSSHSPPTAAMVNWNSPLEIFAEMVAFLKLIHVASGLYFWEFLLSVNVEWALITRQRPFKWPMIFYFINRYSMLALLVIMLYVMNGTGNANVDCKSLITAGQVFFYLALLFSSINLGLRTLALWSVNRYVVAILVALVVGEIVIFTQIKIPANRVPGIGCIPAQLPSKSIAVLHIYPMCFDIVIFALAAWRVRIHEVTSRSRLAVVLFRDGLFYIIVTVLVNIIVVVFEILNLSTFMDAIFNIPAVLAMSVAATRAVRNLQIQADKPVQTTDSISRWSNWNPAISDLHFATQPSATVNGEATTMRSMVSSSQQHVSVPMDYCSTDDAPIEAKGFVAL
ncbi:hypothetical protein K474DRAFT_1632233 [Panus rudis PR-1116 ss-1]|nr:hypothetical protein K474DRAFT_1632233 [Panus rudis PR-1116 ss-1]